MFYGQSAFRPADQSGKMDITSNWKRYSITFIVESGSTVIDANNRVNVFFGIWGTDVTGYICGMQLESGNKVTDWTPAPEDVDSDISNVETNLANTKTALEDDIYGEPFYQYTASSVTYDVWKTEDGKYYYDDGSGVDQKVAESNLDRDDNGLIVVSRDGNTFYQYTLKVIYDVWKAEDGKYYYDDGSGTDKEIAASALDQDSDGYIIVRHGGMQDTVEKIAGSVLIDSVEPSVTIQAKHIEGTDERTAGIKITDERVSFKKNGEEVAYIDSSENEGVIDINNARVHVSLRIGHLELFDHNNGIGIRRYDD